jgi:DNA (cytosine-5)-methyltransferase 1
MALTIGSLFSGVGLLDLGLEEAGLGPVVYQVESDDFCHRVLAKHWPNALRFDDVRDVGVRNLPYVDIICGGFPCQGLSVAGKRLGLSDPRSGLWREYARIVRETQPRFVVVENVARLVACGLDEVVDDLERAGYAVEGRIIAARDVGAPHKRERLFLVAHAGDDRRAGRTPVDGADDGVAKQRGHDAARCRDRGGAHVADTERDALRIEPERREPNETERRDAEPAHDREARGRGAESRMGRSADGSTHRLDRPWPAGKGEAAASWEPPRARANVPLRYERLMALGNGVVPQVARLAGRRVMGIAQKRPSVVSDG